MKTITCKEEAIPLIAESLHIKKNLLTAKLQHYRTQLKTFEQKHNMSSSEFYQQFHQGKLNDDKIWFKWVYLYETYTTLQKELELLNGVQL
jgi:hypothetical protein